MAGKRNGWLGGENQNAGSKQREVRWLTPPQYVNPLGRFDLDPCGAPGHSLADRTLLLENGDDGLRDEWHGRVWLNPPYGKLTEPFLAKLAEHGNGIALVFARTETGMFFREVWPKADALLFLQGRISFLNADRERAKANAGAPSVLVAYGRENAKALRESGISGAFIDLRDSRRLVAELEGREK